jgi:hypothetical protein
VFFSRDSFIINHPIGANDNPYVYVCLVLKRVSCLARYLLIHKICMIFRWELFSVKFYCYKFTVFNSGLCHTATVWVLIRHFGGLYYLHIDGDAYLDKCCHKNGDSIFLLNVDVNLFYQLQNPRTVAWFNVPCLQTEHNRNCTIVSFGMRVFWWPGCVAEITASVSRKLLRMVVKVL